jgi:hypothetical protein
MPPKLDAHVKSLHVIVPVALMRKIEDWRRQQPGLPNVSEAVRQLLEQSLDATAKKGGKHR